MLAANLAIFIPSLAVAGSWQQPCFKLGMSLLLSYLNYRWRGLGGGGALHLT